MTPANRLDALARVADNPHIMLTLFFLLLSPPTSPSPRVEDPRAEQLQSLHFQMMRIESESREIEAEVKKAGANYPELVEKLANLVKKRSTLERQRARLLIASYHKK